MRRKLGSQSVRLTTSLISIFIALSPSLRADDSDNDGYDDDYEISCGSDPYQSGSTPFDIDGDGFPNDVEVNWGYNPNDSADYPVDTDADSYPDRFETNNGSDPNSSFSIPTDWDGDGYTNDVEYSYMTDPNDPYSYPGSGGGGGGWGDPDYDGDGYSDADENTAGSDYMNPLSTPNDLDADGWDNATEITAGSSPTDSASYPYMDTDYDGFYDYDEIRLGSLPDSWASVPDDFDGDGHSNSAEGVANSDPWDPNSYPQAPPTDTDSDGYSDSDEYLYGSDPYNPDSIPTDWDGDDWENSYESLWGFDPNDASDHPVDTDADTYPDHYETHLGTDPNNAASHPGVDSDMDGYPDYVEVAAQSNPNDEDSIPSDRDGDTFTNDDEMTAESDPDNPLSTPDDIDGDGYSNQVEIDNGFLPNDPNSHPVDSDNDGFFDNVENTAGSNPNNAASTPDDIDGDTFSNDHEEMAESDPLNFHSVPTDWDGDSFTNTEESQAGTDPRNAGDFPNAGLDEDYDRRTNLQEMTAVPPTPTTVLWEYTEVAADLASLNERGQLARVVDNAGTIEVERWTGSAWEDAGNLGAAGALIEPATTGLVVQNNFGLVAALTKTAAGNVIQLRVRGADNQVHIFGLGVATDVSLLKAMDSGYVYAKFKGTDGFWRAARSRNGSIKFLETANAHLELIDGNERGEMIATIGGAGRIWTGNEWEALDGGALALNNRGQALISRLHEGTLKAFVWKAGDATATGQALTGFTEWKLNDLGVIAMSGSATNARLVYPGGSVVNLAPPQDSIFTSPKVRVAALNEVGEVAGNLYYAQGIDAESVTVHHEAYSWLQSYGTLGGEIMAETKIRTITNSGRLAVEGLAAVNGQGEPRTGLLNPQNDADGDGMPTDWETHYQLSNPTADPDNDGLGNLGEYLYNTLPAEDDTDGDGLTDGWEVAHGYDPTWAGDLDDDLDGDGLSAEEELAAGSDLERYDSDGDGLSDGQELALGTGIWDGDSDDDNWTDGYEFANNMNPLDPEDGALALNSNGSPARDLEDLDPMEEAYGEHDGPRLTPTAGDTDGDGLPDAWENKMGLRRGDALDRWKDSDGDGLINWVEYFAGTHPRLRDSDGDGLIDGQELLKTGTHPLVKDTDRDGRDDALEVYSSQYSPADPNDSAGSLPIPALPGNFDLDQDGLSNDREAETRTGTWSVHYESTTRVYDSFYETWVDQTTSTDEGPFEFQYATYSHSADSDRDGLPDEFEISNTYSTTTTSGELLPEQESSSQSTTTTSSFNPQDANDGNADFDGDGWSNGEEYQMGSNMYAANGPQIVGWIEERLFKAVAVVMNDPSALLDADSDGLNNYMELLANSNGNDNDDDGDTRGDGIEIFDHLTDPAQAQTFTDTDGDSLGDTIESTVLHTNPANLDSDGDSLPDGWELRFGLNPLVANEISEDVDQDGLNYAQELAAGTFPNQFDSDGDGWSDQQEIDQQTDPLDLAEYPQLAATDVDGDRMLDSWETLHGFNPLDPADALFDSDGDHVSNFREYVAGTDPHTEWTSGSAATEAMRLGQLPEHLAPPASVPAIAPPAAPAGSSNKAWNDRGEVVRDSLHWGDFRTLTLLRGSQAQNLGVNEVSFHHLRLNRDRQVVFGGELTTLDENQYVRATQQIGWTKPGQAPRLLAAFTWPDASAWTTPSITSQTESGHASGGLGYGGFVALDNELFVFENPYIDSNGTYNGSVSLTVTPSGYVIYHRSGELEATTYPDIMYVTETATQIFKLGDDVDADGISDDWELAYGLDPNNAADATANYDGDDLSNFLEYVSLTHPRNPDTDGDGVSDSLELRNRLNPLSEEDNMLDADGDGLSDGSEIAEHGTNARDDDSDNDGLTDGEEVLEHGTNAVNNDTDWDGVEDGVEVNGGHNPRDAMLDTSGRRNQGIADSTQVLNVWGAGAATMPNLDDEGRPGPGQPGGPPREIKDFKVGFKQTGASGYFHRGIYSCKFDELHATWSPEQGADRFVLTAMVNGEPMFEKEVSGGASIQMYFTEFYTAQKYQFSLRAYDAFNNVIAQTNGAKLCVPDWAIFTDEEEEAEYLLISPLLLAASIRENHSGERELECDEEEPCQGEWIIDYSETVLADFCDQLGEKLVSYRTVWMDCYGQERIEEEEVWESCPTCPDPCKCQCEGQVETTGDGTSGNPYKVSWFGSGISYRTNLTFEKDCDEDGNPEQFQDTTVKLDDVTYLFPGALHPDPDTSHKLIVSHRIEVQVWDAQSETFLPGQLTEPQLTEFVLDPLQTSQLVRMGTDIAIPAAGPGQKVILHYSAWLQIETLGGGSGFHGETPDKWRISASASDGAGSAYRKIGLNGRPLRDGKPQTESETDVAPEETYIDALTLGLNHSTSDAYVPLPHQNTELSVNRSTSPTIWSFQNGLRPHERWDMPFGPGWSSNLAAFVQVTTTHKKIKVQRDIGGDFEFWTEAGKSARVIDASGGSQGFTYDRNSRNWIALPAGTGKRSLENTLSGDELTGFTYTKRFGQTMRYEGKTAYRKQSIPRYVPFHETSMVQEVSWCRLASATDLTGNVVDYSYSGAVNLVPSRIASLGGSIAIFQNSDGYVTSVRDSRGNSTSYEYNHTIPYTSPLGSQGSVAALSRVVRADGSSVSYNYEFVPEVDLYPLPIGEEATALAQRGIQPIQTRDDKYHINVNSITNANGEIYEFTYDFNKDVQTKRHHDSHPNVAVFYQETGQPRGVTRVDLPGTAFATFSGGSALQVGEVVGLPEQETPGFYDVDATVTGSAATSVTDAEGYSTSYNFGNASQFKFTHLDYYGFKPESLETVLTYSSMTVGHAAGTEVFAYDDKGNLESVTDISQNTTIFEYDDRGNMETQTNARNETRSYDYTLGNLLKSVTDEEGRRSDYSYVNSVRMGEINYNPQGDPIQETALEYHNPFNHAAPTRQRHVKLPWDNSPAESWVIDYEYNRQGRVMNQIVDPGSTGTPGLRLITSYDYDVAGNKTRVIDPKGYVTQFRYDARNRLTGVVNPDGTTRTLHYDAGGRKDWEINERGVKTFYLYDELDRLTKTTIDYNENDAADGRGTDIVSEQKYNKVGSVIEVIDPRGIVTKHDYDDIQRLKSTTVAFGTDEEATTTFDYDPLKNPGSSVFDSTGWKPTRSISPAPEGFGAATVTTEVEYDELYRPTLSRVEYQPGLFAETVTEYDKVGNVTKVTDPLGKITLTVPDDLNRPIQVTNPDGTTVQTVYNSLGQVWKVIDELGRVTETLYDSAGRAEEVLAPEVLNESGQPVKPSTKTKYDANGNVFKITNPLGQDTETYYDNRNRPAHIVSPEAYDAQSGQNVAAIVSTEYDEVGNPVKVIDAFGYEAVTFYDPANRAYETRGPPVTVHGLAQPVQPTTVSVHDANGNVLKVTDPKGNKTENTYDSLNRLRSTKTWPNAADLEEFIQVQFEYDDAGNRTKVIDGNLFATLFDYDGLNRNTCIELPDGAKKFLEYDELNLTARVDEDGRRTEYTYDDRHRLDTVTYIDAAGTGVDHTRTYHYDNASKILTVDESHDNRADVAYTYDALGRTKTETSNGVTHTYTYDIGGNLRNVVHGNTGREIVSTYDALNRLDTMTENGRATTYYYDARGAIVGKMLPNGQLVVEEIDAGGRKLGSTAYTDGAQTDVVYDYTYGYDIAGNVVHTDENVGGTTRTISMVYDDVYRLIGETIAEGATTTVTTYAYDKNSNRLSRTKDIGPGADEVTTYVLDPTGLNQLRSLILPNGGGTVTYTYDEAGNRVSRTDANGTDTYAYDYETRLLSLEDALPEAGEAAYQYVYDYRTRRVVRDESAAVSGVVTQLVFSGGLSVQEYDDPSNPQNLSGASAKVEYIRGSDWGGGVGGVLYTLRDGAPSYNHYNNRGDVVAKTDGTGSLTYQAGYEAFGTRTSESGATEDRQKANTKDEDPTGLLNEGMRYRDLEAGVWLTRDPAGFVDGPNLYAYVRQNPWSSFDPDGLEARILFNSTRIRDTNSYWHQDYNWFGLRFQYTEEGNQFGLGWIFADTGLISWDWDNYVETTFGDKTTGASTQEKVGYWTNRSVNTAGTFLDYASLFSRGPKVRGGGGGFPNSPVPALAGGGRSTAPALPQGRGALLPIPGAIQVNSSNQGTPAGPEDSAKKLPADKISDLVAGAKPSMATKGFHQYENPGHHQPSSGKYVAGKEVLPENHIDLWNRSVPIKSGDGSITRWAREGTGRDAVYHRFQGSNDTYHWNGSTNGRTKSGEARKIPSEKVPTKDIDSLLDK